MNAGAPTKKQRPRKSKSPDASAPGLSVCVAICVESNLGAVEWIRTTTVLLPPAPQAGASASSATTARANLLTSSEVRLLCETPIIGGFRCGVNIRQWGRLQPVLLRSAGAMPCGSQGRKNCGGVTTAHRPFGSQGKQERLRHSLGPPVEMLAVRAASELDPAQNVSRKAARRLSALALNSARSLPTSARRSAALSADSSAACARMRMRSAAASSAALAAKWQYTTPTSSRRITERIVAASPRATASIARSRGSGIGSSSCTHCVHKAPGSRKGKAEGCVVTASEYAEFVAPQWNSGSTGVRRQAARENDACANVKIHSARGIPARSKNAFFRFLSLRHLAGSYLGHRQECLCYLPTIGLEIRLGLYMMACLCSVAERLSSTCLGSESECEQGSLKAARQHQRRCWPCCK